MGKSNQFSSGLTLDYTKKKSTTQLTGETDTAVAMRKQLLGFCMTVARIPWKFFTHNFARGLTVAQPILNLTAGYWFFLMKLLFPLAFSHGLVLHIEFFNYKKVITNFSDKRITISVFLFNWKQEDKIFLKILFELEQKTSYVVNYDY